MSWLEGEVKVFPGGKPKHRDVRKVRTDPDQHWDDQYFFHISKALEAGYPPTALQDGCPIRFEPDPNASRPRVRRVAPYEGTERKTPPETGDRFLNPYHFVPLVAPPEDSLVHAKTYLDEEPLHDRFAPSRSSEGRGPRYSGRILVRLTTEGPVVVGSTQERVDGSEDKETKVAPFTLPDPDAKLRPAIPGSSLRGLLSSIVEAASCSTMRVLHDGEYSYSAGPKTGRRWIPGTLYGAIRRWVSPDLLPFGKGRTHLTLAERLFGFVEHEGDKALAGRVRVAHALADGEPKDGSWFEEEVTLKILSTPKPLDDKPTVGPAFYFGNQGYLSKQDLDLTEHSPQGRKVYLHHPEEDVRAGCYKTGDSNPKRRKQKMIVEPLKEGTSFLFHIDFVNLKREELGFLLYALRPTEEFRHKIGLGKPIGLGQVLIEPLALAFIDRGDAYRPEGVFGPRYHSFDWCGPALNWGQLPVFLDRRYRHERAAVEVGAGRDGNFPAVEELRASVRAGIPENVRWALELVGDPNRVGTQVTYPILHGPGPEGEHYKWFVANDDHYRKVLEVIEPNEELPTLEKYP